MQATLTSTKATETVTGTLAEVMTAAISMEDTLQPAYGVTIECDDGRTFECRNGRIDIYTDGEDGEEGAVVMTADGLMIAWQQGIRTPMFDAPLQAA